MYVCRIDPAENTVTLGPDSQLYTKTLIAEDVDLIAVPSLPQPVRLTAKIRYRHNEQPATVTQLGPDRLKIEFDAPQRAITKGQSVVLYDGDVVVGGGTICSLEA